LSDGSDLCLLAIAAAISMSKEASDRVAYISGQVISINGGMI